MKERILELIKNGLNLISQGIIGAITYLKILILLIKLESQKRDESKSWWARRVRPARTSVA